VPHLGLNAPVPLFLAENRSQRRRVRGGEPSEPLRVTSIMKDAGATVSFYAPVSVGSGAVTHYVVTPYVGGAAQAATTVAVGSLTSLADSSGGTALQATVTGLTNGTAYTFTVRARNSFGDGGESKASGANTPLSGLVFGDDFNGPAGGPVDPEWWVYDRCGYLAQNEVQWYKPSNCVLDGSSNLVLTAENVTTSGPRYPSDPSFPGTINQPWRSGACQGNSRLFAPTSGNTMTFESKFQVMADAGSGFWPGMFWLEGQDYLTAWKTDPLQQGWDSTGKAEIDVAEWFQSGAANSYGNVSWAGTNEQTNQTGSGLATSQHIYAAAWKPGVNVKFYRDGSLTATHTAQVPASGAQFFLLLYLQMLAGGATTTESITVDYVRVYDQNLG
jgi:hypothetical protein